jgi:hypothetical protein
VNSAVRYGEGFARLGALRSRLWSPVDRALLLRAGIEPDGRPVDGSPQAVFPPLVRWYATVARVYPEARPILTALLRRHEIENVKLLWRAAVRARPPIEACWRPLGPLARVAFEPRPLRPDALVARLASTPYGDVARAMLRSHVADLPASEMGFDRWVWMDLYDQARRLPARESATFQILRLLVIEHDVDLLRRGTAFGLDSDLVAKAAIALPHDRRVATLPPPIARLIGSPASWPEALRALRRIRLRACRRAFVGWPFRLAPPIAATLLRDEQARAAMTIAAARGAPDAAADVLPAALAASPLEG